MLLIEIPDIQQLIQRIGLKSFYQALIATLTQDFSEWESFEKCSRHATYVPNGVIELMPICGQEFYSFKYVNGHPENSIRNKATVVACGLLADVASGYPLLLSEMTLLTALRTAATASLASKYLARKDSKVLAIIGCGAQSAFQVLAHALLFPLETIRYFDLDPNAMTLFAEQLQDQAFKLTPTVNAEEAVKDADIIITATAKKGKHKVLEYSWLRPGQHICGIGGDAPGKTELDPEILTQSKIVVEYLPQTEHEGEIQNLGAAARKHVHAELWELIVGKKPGRKDTQELTLFDSVGFALEDYSSLRLVYKLATQYGLGQKVELIPEHQTEVKNLFSLLVPSPTLAQDKNN